MENGTIFVAYLKYVAVLKLYSILKTCSVILLFTISGSMLVAFSDAISELESWSTGRGVIVYGSGHTFCSGGDLNMAKQVLNPTDGERMSRFMQNILNRLYQLPLITVALIEGRALGGGAEVACACDFRSMSASAAIGFVQTKLSVSPGWGAGARLVEILGRTKALQVLASGIVLATKDALKIGLADVAVPDGQFAVEETLTFLRTFTAGTTKATQAAKKVVVNASPLDLEKAAKGETEIFKTVWGSPEHLQALDKAIKFTSTR